MSKKYHLGLSARLLFFILPVIAGSFLVSGYISVFLAERGVTKAMNRLLEYKAEDLIRFSSSQWNLLLDNNLQGDEAYLESLKLSIRSYALTVLRDEKEWIFAVDGEGKVVFSVGASVSDGLILDSIADYPVGETDGFWINGTFCNEKRTGYGFYLSYLDWTVFITDLQETYYGDLSSLRLILYILVAFNLLISSLFIYFYVRWSMKPLYSVISDMREIVTDRNFEKRVIPHQNDEVGELAREFNLMSDYLDRAMSRLKNIAHSEAEARIEIRNRERETLEVLSSVSDHKDPETALHTSRVGMYAALLSELQGDFQDEIDLMRWAVPLHDIGKVGIPDAILLKNRALNAEERSVMESHVTIGYDILKDSASPILRAGADIAISHHERWDGSGYPKGLKGRDIPARGRITGLVDVFDALTTARPYKEAWNLDRTVEWIKGRSGRDFDPEIVELFIKGLDRIREILAEYGEVEDSGSESALT